jgi:hypothetical protein
MYQEKLQQYKKLLAETKGEDERRRLHDVIRVYEHLTKCKKVHSLQYYRGKAQLCNKSF